MIAMEHYEGLMTPPEEHRRRSTDSHVGKTWWQLMEPREKIGMILIIAMAFTMFIVYPAVLILVNFDSNAKIKQANDRTAEADAKLAELEKAFNEGQAANREVGYQSRAATCRLLLIMKLPLGPNCLDANVVKYYDPTDPYRILSRAP
jgi:hypothetical protein